MSRNNSRSSAVSLMVQTCSCSLTKILNYKRQSQRSSTKNALSIVFIMTCVLRALWAMHADTHTHVWIQINNSHLAYINTTTTNTATSLKPFSVLMKCRNKRLVYEMLFIRELKPTLDFQSDSIRAKLFLLFNLAYFYYVDLA